MTQGHPGYTLGRYMTQKINPFHVGSCVKKPSFDGIFP